MAFVIHTIKGHQYLYEHKRIGKKVHCTYVYPCTSKGIERTRVTQHKTNKHYHVVSGALAIKNLPYEVGLIYDSKTKKLLYQKSQKKLGAIRFNEDDVKPMKGNILVHNHPEPSRSSFSVNDYTILGNYRLAEIIAVTEHKMYSLKAETPEATRECMDIHHKLNLKQLKIKRRLEKQYPNENWEQISHRINKELSDGIEGLTYTSYNI